MSAKFRKVSAKRQKPVHKKAQPLSKRPADASEQKTPVTRVGEGRDHHDTLSTKIWYVLVDQPLKPEDSVSLDQGSHRWPMLFTTNAEPLYDSLLVFMLKFEHVADAGKCELKLRCGDSTSELFSGVETADMFLDDFISCPPAVRSGDAQDNKRLLDYTTIPPRPSYDDKNLDQKAPPHSALTKEGAKEGKGE